MILFIISGTKWQDADDWALENLLKNKAANTQVVLVINKIDKVVNKEQLLPFVEKIQAKYNFKEITPKALKETRNIRCGFRAE